MDTDTPAPLPSPVVPAKDDDPAAPATKEEETAEGDEWFYFDTKFDLSLQESRLFSPKTIDPSGTHSWRLMLFPRGNGNDARGHWISCYLEVCDIALDWSRAVEFNMTLSLEQLPPAKGAGDVTGPDAPAVLKKGPQTHRYDEHSSDWGFPQAFELRAVQGLFSRRGPAPRREGDDGGEPSGTEGSTIFVRVALRDLPDRPPFTPYDSKRETGMVGLRNQGATCYMNSLLQTLYHLRKLRVAVYRMPTVAEDHGSIGLAMQRVFYQLQTHEKEVPTRQLTKAFGWEAHDSFQQQDVQELNRVLCDKLEEKMKGTCVEGTIKQLFEGGIRSYITCVNVDYESSRDESYYDVQLDVKGLANLEQSLEKYIEVEMLDGDNQYEAEGHGKQDARKGVTFARLPPVLNIQLKRFEYDPQTGNMVKINDRFEFPQQLNLDRFLAAPAAGAVPAPAPSPPNDYVLHSVLVHSGDVHGGHYYVYIRPSGESSGGQWSKFDDEMVTNVTEDEVLAGSYGGYPPSLEPPAPPPPVSTGTEDLVDMPGTQPPAPPRRIRQPSALARCCSSAYMLVYVRQSDLSEIMPEVTEQSLPAELLERFKAEEAEETRRLKERAEAHLFMTVDVVADASVLSFDAYSEKPACDFVDFRRDAMQLRVRKASSVAELMAAIEARLGVPRAHQRLWTCSLRENGSTRPDTCVTLARADVPQPLEATVESLAGVNGVLQGGAAHPPKQKAAELKLFVETLGQLPTIMVMGDDAKSAVEVDAVITVISPAKLAEAAADHSKNVCETAAAPPLPPTADTEGQPTSPTSRDGGVGLAEDTLESVAAIKLARCHEALLIFFKYYEPPGVGADNANGRLSLVGRALVHSNAYPAQLLPAMRRLAGLEGNASLHVVEEVMPSMVNELKLESTFSENELINGDMICFQRTPTAPSDGGRLPALQLVTGFLDERINRRTVLFRPRTEDDALHLPQPLPPVDDTTPPAGAPAPAPAKPPQMIKIVLSAKSSFRQVMEKLTARLCAVNEPTRLRFTQPNTMASGMLTAPLGVPFRILSRNLDVGAPSEQYPSGNQSYNLNALLTVPLTTGGQFVTDTLFFEVLPFALHEIEANKVIEVMLNDVRLVARYNGILAQKRQQLQRAVAQHATGMRTAAIGGGAPRRKRRNSEEAVLPSTAQVQQVTLLMHASAPVSELLTKLRKTLALEPDGSLPPPEREDMPESGVAAAGGENADGDTRMHVPTAGTRRLRLVEYTGHSVSPGVLVRAPLMPNELCGELPESKQFSDLKPPPVGYGNAFPIPANRLALELLDDDELALYEGRAGMAQRASATTTLPSASVVGGDAPPQWVPVQLVSYYVLNGYVQVHGTPLLTYCSSLDTFVTFCARVARRVGTLGAESHESWRVALLVNHKPQPLNDEMKTHLWALLLKEFQHLAKSPDREASFFQKADEYEYDDDDDDRLLARCPTLGIERSADRTGSKVARRYEQGIKIRN